MDDFVGLLRQTQYHVVILAAVLAFVIRSCDLKKPPAVNRQMTDIVMCTEIVFRIIWLKSGIKKILHCAVELCFIRKDKVRILFQDYTYCFKQGTGMEQDPVARSTRHLRI